MGKAQKKKKTQAWRHNPIRVPDAHLPSGKGQGQADPVKEKQMLPVLNKVCNSTPSPCHVQSSARVSDADLKLDLDSDLDP